MLSNEKADANYFVPGMKFDAICVGIISNIIFKTQKHLVEMFKIPQQGVLSVEYSNNNNSYNYFSYMYTLKTLDEVLVDLEYDISHISSF